MNHIQKFLVKLNNKERTTAELLIARIISRDLAGLDLEKLKGKTNVWRVRKGDLRITFSLVPNGAEIIDIDRKDDNTYR